MNTKKIVVLADIESVRVPFTSFEKGLKEVAKYGDIAGCKFYGYSAKRTKDYADFIADNSYDALSSLAGKRKGKLDLRQVIDATRLAETRKIDGIFLMYGKGNIKPLISYLRNLGMEVYAGVISPDDNSTKCNQTVILEEGLLYTQISHAKIAAPKAAPAPAPAPAAAPFAAPAAAPNAAPKPAANSDDDDMIAKLTALLSD